MTNADEVVNYSRKSLAPYLDQWGRLLYSSADTLQPGEIYLLGLNPAGVSNDEKDKLKYDINSLPFRKENAYINEAWNKGNGGVLYKKGEAPLQKRVVHLLRSLGQDPKSVCASNLVFIGSNDQYGIKNEWIEPCLKVHEKIIDIVQPKLILCFGNSDFSPYGYLRKYYLQDCEDKPESAKHHTWLVKGFEAEIDGRSVYVAGVPHLSRYDITTEERKSVIAWLQEKLDRIKKKRE